jgi:colanic acid biosynthesis glycosyl transferase WcaI
MEKKRVLLIGGNYYPEPTGIGKYNAEMMGWLVSQNYECGVITTYPYYPFWKIQPPYTNKSYWYKKEEQSINDKSSITVYRCPHYIPARPTGKKRVLSDVSFFLSAFFQVARLLFREKYNYVIMTAPPFQIGLLGWFYKKFKGACIIYHIHDLQIDAARELGMIKTKYLVGLMLNIERLILRKADFVSTISEGMIKKIAAKYNRRILLFPNWADINAFYPIADKDSLKMQFNFSPADKIILYSGAIGQKQGLQALLYTAKQLQDFKFIKFIICGSGPYKDKLVTLAKHLQVENVSFLPLQPAEKFNQFMNMADAHLVMQKANENELFLPSKLTTICAVGGLMIVTAPESTSLYDIVSKNKIGILINPEDQDALTMAVKMAIYQDYTAIKNNARKFALDFLSGEKIIAKYFSIINPPVEIVAVPSNKEHESLQHNDIPNIYVNQNREA